MGHAVRQGCWIAALDHNVVPVQARGKMCVRFVRWLLCGLCVMFWLTGGSSYAQQSQPDRDTYEGWLREALVAARRADRPGLEQIAASLSSTTEVQVGNGATVSIDNTWLAQALDTPEPDFAQISLRLSALLDALVQPPPAAPPDAQQRLRDILSRPPFVTAESDNENLLTRFLDWLMRILERLFEPLGEVGASTGNALSWMIVAVSAVLLVGAILYLLLKLRGALTSEAQSTADNDSEAYLTSAIALQQANALAQGGNYRTAVRYLYLSSLLWLDEHGLLRYDRALTNQEYLASLASNPELRMRLLPIVETFDQVWYGHAPLDSERFLTYQQQVEALRTQKRVLLSTGE